MNADFEDSHRTVVCPACGQANPEYNPTCVRCDAALPEDALDVRPSPRPDGELTASLHAAEPQAEPAEAGALVAGTLVGPYRVLGLLGRGGMGLVYRAVDTQLGRAAALKFLPAPKAQEPRSQARLLREAQAASALDHANIGTVYGLGAHEGQPYIALALYEGETLRERLARGPVEPAEAESILFQLASGLAAAHAAGVVHRDLKPANVLLTHGGQAKILDFGLAMLLGKRPGADAGDSLTRSGQLLGTVPYMAPEQARGGAVDERSDLWALGVVAYEMLSGANPFRAETAEAVLYRIHSVEPPPLVELCPRVGARLERLVAQLLSRDPASRPVSAAQVVQALGGARPFRIGDGMEDSTAGLSPRRARAPRLLRRAALAGAAALTLGGTAALLASWSGHGEPEWAAGAAAVVPRRSVAVLGFKNLSGRREAEWLSTALAEMLGAELAAGEKLRVLPGESVARARIELELPPADSYAPDTLARLRRNLGTDLVVLGSYVALGEKASGKLDLVLRLQDTSSGETLASLTDAGAEAQLFELVSRSGAQLRGRLGVGARLPEQAEQVRASLPSSPEAARLYAEGLARLRLFDLAAARERLEKAVAADPDHALAHAALSEVWAHMGEVKKERQAAARAYELAGSLSREERLMVEARFHASRGDVQKAGDLYQGLLAFHPDNLEYGLRLAQMQSLTAGRRQDALTTIESLRRLPRSPGEDLRIDLLEVEALVTLERFEKARTTAARLSQRSRAHGARFVLSEALYWKGWALLNLGEGAEARAPLDEAGQIQTELGYTTALATTLYVTAHALVQQGNLASARSLYSQAQEIYGKLGRAELAANAGLDLAYLLSIEGKLADAGQAYLEALAYFGDQRDLYAARALLGIGNVARAQGRLAEARKGYADALVICVERGAESWSAHAIWGLSAVLMAVGDLDGARKGFERALEIWRSKEERLSAAATRLDLASLWIEDGHPQRAEALAREVLQELRPDQLADYGAPAQEVLARALLEQHNPEEALAAINRAAELAKQSQDHSLRLSVSITAGRIRAAAGPTGGRAQAMADLESALSEAVGSGAVVLAFEARLALGAVELASGREAAGRTRLEALEKDARERGFALIAGKAGRALGRPVQAPR